MDEKRPLDDQSEEISPDALAASKRKARLNALLLVAVLILSTVAPTPWNLFAPLLLIVPIIYAFVNRLRRGTPTPEQRARSAAQQNPLEARSTIDPYSYTPKDPKDLRRYKPIG